MRDETLVRYVIGERPSNAPEGWTVWNAPRPLYGEIVWHGDFVKGCFYAATNPDAAEYMDVRGQEIRNRDLDACQIEWVTRDKAAQIARERYGTFRADVTRLRTIRSHQNKCTSLLTYVNGIV